jgi:hypothetical protein
MALPKTKRKAPRAAPRIKRGGKIEAPGWDGWEEWTGQQIHRHRQHTRQFYYEEFKPADLYPAVFEWMEKSGEYTKEQIKHAKAMPNTFISVTSAIVAKQFLNGMPGYVKAEDEYWQSLPGTIGEAKDPKIFLQKRIEHYIEEGSKVVVEKKEEAKNEAKKHVPTIQERIRDQAYEMAEPIDEWLEVWISDKDNFDPKGFDFKKHFKKIQPSQAHARKMRSFWESELEDFNELERFPTAGQLKKMSEFEADQWAQLKEGYSHLKKSDIAKYRKAIETVNAELDFIIEQAKATRKPRKPKQRSASKIVEKLKFNKADDKYSLASIDPTLIVGANELWVFNVKTRKLGKYVASNVDPKGLMRDGTGLSVKGTTIIGFDEKSSVQKTLRKPEEQLKEFKAAGKVALRKFLEEINTTDTKLNGRCNPDTVLLKVS